MWSRVFGKGVCSRHCCSTFFSRRCCVWRRTASPLMQSATACKKGEKGEKKEGRARVGRVDRQKKEEAAQTLWGMLYADDAGIVSRSPEGLEKMTVTVIVTACAAFGLTVSEAKTEIMCLQTKGGGHVPFTVTAAGQVYKQTVEFVYLGGGISADWDLGSVEVLRRIQRAWACFGWYKWKSMTDRVCGYT